MPACASDNTPNLTESLRNNLSVRQGVDQSVISSAKKALLHQIDFKSAVKSHSLQIDSLRTKYIPLNPSKNYGSSSIEPVSRRDHNSFKGKMSEKPEKSGEGLPSPRVVLYPEEKINLQWKKIHKVGLGLENMGNTCYVNAPLQSLCYTAPLVNYAYSQDHSFHCKNPSGCLMCEFQRHVRQNFDGNKGPLTPSGIFSRVKHKSVSPLKLFTNGKQEDAHEFLRYFLDGMQKSCLYGHNKLDRYSKETTVINQIFGGFLRSQVQCTRCKNRSNTYDPFMDLSLDLRFPITTDIHGKKKKNVAFKNCNSMDKCFEKFFMSEYLEGDNAYMCPVCQQKVKAQKRFTIQKAPNVLTVHLKRFDFDRMCKVTRHIDFEKKLNIRPYMSFRQGEPIMYDLSSIIVHAGYGMTAGHYYSYNKAPNMIWYKMNDEIVEPVSAHKVFHCEAYVLLYVKSELNYQNIQIAKAALMGPMKPLSMFPNSNNNYKKANGNPTNELGTAIARKTSTTKSLFSPDRALFTPDKVIKSASTPSILPAKHEKVSFGIKPNHHKDPSKPPIIVKIKNGKVYNETEDRKAKLVPYGNDSDSDSSRSSGSRKRKKEKDADDDKGAKVAGTSTNNIVMNGHLDTTTSVPGNSKLLRSVSENGIISPTNKSKELYLKLNKSTKLNGDTSAILSPKVNATNNHWSVQFNDSAPSPCSSSNHSSTNSTSEWHVTGGKDQNKLSEKTHNGWTVTPNGSNTSICSVTSDCKDIHPIDSSDKNVNGVLTDAYLGLKSDKNDTSVNNCLGDAPMLNLKREQYGVETDITTNGVSNPVFNKDYETSFKVNSKKEKCNDYKLDDFYCNRMRVDVSDKQHLLSEPSSPQISQRKHKKAKKHKKEKEGKYEELVNESSSSGDKKLKKKKKKHRKHENDSDEEVKVKKLKRKSEERDMDSDIDIKKAKCNVDEDYEWVEKKVDSKPVKQDDGISWDYYINKDKRDEKPVHVSGWDGQKSSNIVKELEKNSMHGYGGSVLSWDGNKSKLNEECDRERVREKRKIDRDDDYDEEYDRGKIKKVKTKQEDDRSFGFNPFQKFQDYRNKKTNGSSSSHSSPCNKRWKSSSSFHGKHSYSQTHHHGNHHSSHHHHHHHRSENNNNYRRHDNNRHYNKH